MATNNSDTNCLELTQTPQVKAQSHKTISTLGSNFKSQVPCISSDQLTKNHRFPWSFPVQNNLLEQLTELRKVFSLLLLAYYKRFNSWTDKQKRSLRQRYVRRCVELPHPVWCHILVLNVLTNTEAPKTPLFRVFIEVP